MKTFFKKHTERAKAMLLRFRDGFRERISTPDGRRRLIIVLLVGVFCFCLLMADRVHLLPALAVGALASLIASMLFRKDKKGLSVLLWCLGPPVSFLAVEIMIGNVTPFPFSSALYAPDEILLNLVWYYLFAWVLFLICGRRKLSSVLSAAFFLVLGLTDSYFFAFRGRVLFPSDLVGIRTAMNVVGEYDFTPSASQVIGTLLIAAYIAATVLLPRSRGRETPKWYVSLSSAALCAGYIAFFFCTPFLKWTGFEGKLWTSLWNTRENGVVLNLTVNLRFSSIEKPEDYGEQLERLRTEYRSDEADAETVRPHIIAVMNEALCDLSALGVETDAPCLPFMDSLSENTVKGRAYVSVLGGHTANSEFEFLTGNSVSFLPVGTVAFQMFTRDGDYSLPGQLKELGYYNIAMHPYYASGWNRVAVYERYRFDEMHFIEDFEGVEDIRSYCSDRSDYENVIRAYEAHLAGENADRPLFLFNVTMQNHGGYSPDWRGLQKTVGLAGDAAGKYEDADLYLSLARESDSAFRELIGYFRDREEPVVVVMFGDHEPRLSESFYTDVFGKGIGEMSREESVCLYEVPYVIWANYDIPEREENFSLNYLSAVLCETLGLPLTGYQKFLCEAKRALPVVTRNFYADLSGRYTGLHTELTEEAQRVLASYRALQYNGLKEDRIPEIFFLQ